MGPPSDGVAPVMEEGICCESGESLRAFWALSAIEDKKLGSGIFTKAEIGREDKEGYG